MNSKTESKCFFSEALGLSLMRTTLSPRTKRDSATVVDSRRKGAV